MPRVVIFVVDPNPVPVLVRCLDSILVVAVVLDLDPNLILSLNFNSVLALIPVLDPNLSPFVVVDLKSNLILFCFNLLVCDNDGNTCFLGLEYSVTHV